MNKKLIFLDIDGTLTEPGKNVPPESALMAIREAREAGHKVLLCSGRNYGMLSPLLQYGFDGAVCSAGGYILYHGEAVYDCPMTRQQQTVAMEALKYAGVYRTIETKHNTYTDEGLKKFLAEGTGGNSELARWREQLEKALGIQPISLYNGDPVYKIVFVAPNASCLQRPREILESSFQFCVQEPDAAGRVNGELINRKFHKGMAVERLCRYLGMDVADTIGFGDSMNDLEMIETVGTGVCMENGSAALKARAYVICPSVSEDGLYRGFAQLGLLK